MPFVAQAWRDANLEIVALVQSLCMLIVFTSLSAARKRNFRISLPRIADNKNKTDNEN
jgi:hypothetical protein